MSLFEKNRFAYRGQDGNIHLWEKSRYSDLSDSHRMWLSWVVIVTLMYYVTVLAVVLTFNPLIWVWAILGFKTNLVPKSLWRETHDNLEKNGFSTDGFLSDLLRPLPNELRVFLFGLGAIVFMHTGQSEVVVWIYMAVYELLTFVGVRFLKIAVQSYDDTRRFAGESQSSFLKRMKHIGATEDRMYFYKDKKKINPVTTTTSDKYGQDWE